MTRNTQTNRGEYTDTTDENKNPTRNEYTVTADHPTDPDPTTLTTTDESWALWWIWNRDATVTDESGRELTGDELWDRLGNGRTNGSGNNGAVTAGDVLTQLPSRAPDDDAVDAAISVSVLADRHGNVEGNVSDCLETLNHTLGQGLLFVGEVFSNMVPPMVRQSGTGIDDLTDSERIILEVLSESSGEIKGRTKLMKIVFLTEFYDTLHEDLVTEEQVGVFNDFIIHNYGPFSVRVMKSLETLVKKGVVVEDEEITQYGDFRSVINLNVEYWKTVESTQDHVGAIVSEFGTNNGKDLERICLELLDISKEEKEKLRGDSIKTVIQ